MRGLFVRKIVARKRRLLVAAKYLTSVFDFVAFSSLAQIVHLNIFGAACGFKGRERKEPGKMV